MIIIVSSSIITIMWMSLSPKKPQQGFQACRSAREESVNRFTQPLELYITLYKNVPTVSLCHVYPVRVYP